MNNKTTLDIIEEDCHYYDGYNSDNSDTSYSSDTWINTITNDEIDECCDTIEVLIEDYVNKYICKMSCPNFYIDLHKEIAENIFHLLLISENCEEFDYEEIEELVRIVSNYYFENNSHIIPLRSMNTCDSITTYFENTNTNLDVLQKQIEKLTNITVIKQRSLDWYAFRNQIITASSIWKALGSQSQINSIIHEKCKSYSDSLQIVKNGDNENTTNININTPLHWGVKYEPVSIMIYEKMFNTKITEFGCIEHSTYNFIGASPDGINTDIHSPLYGRMIEIKNIFNRKITGIPKKEYWIQTQVQMETCELDECDFIETRFKEFSSEDEFYNTSPPLKNETKPYFKGIILYFIKKYSNSTSIPPEIINTNSYNEPHYIYMPLHIDLNPTAVNDWINTMCLEKESEYILFNTIYWWLDEISCVLIKRNRLWFQSIFPQIENVWNMIQTERVSRYENAPFNKDDIYNQDVSPNGIKKQCKTKDKPKICLIKCDIDGNVI